MLLKPLLCSQTQGESLHIEILNNSLSSVLGNLHVHVEGIHRESRQHVLSRQSCARAAFYSAHSTRVDHQCHFQSRITRSYRDCHPSQLHQNTLCSMKMPVRKEEKEAVVYPPSKRKAPPFKPQRPGKIPADGQSSSSASRAPGASLSKVGSSSLGARSGTSRIKPNTAKSTTVSRTATKKGPAVISDDEEHGDGDEDESHEDDGADLDAPDVSSDELPDNPLLSWPTKLAPSKRKRAPKQPSPLSRQSDHSMHSPEASPVPSYSDTTPTIPRPLLLRLMHEHFESKATKIDKHAVVVLQKYLDMFVRETLARAALSRRQDVEEGRAAETDSRWLERKDLEKVAGSMILDFS